MHVNKLPFTVVALVCILSHGILLGSFISILIYLEYYFLV